ncbi:palmdelphin-like [Salarias fasciatus]|uniref:palmdelphin-like n=1 Tax=Salarias fasciatus TaxID=181472 RepID=UPI001176BD08|nr:palmdelphin-like [Salarias fasciatus]
MTEECELLKERLQAITEKHRIQESIRQKKLELDQEKLELQRLKTKVLKEQWLLQDSASHNAPNSTQAHSVLCDQQQTRALQLSIHRIEMELDYLEREESMISVNESFILNRLRTVEKSPEDIIKEAQDSFVPALFAMEINVAKNMVTGESQVLSTADVAPEEIGQRVGLKVYEDETKCIYAFSPQEGSADWSSAQELSANEVEHLLRSASEHRQLSQSRRRSLGGDELRFNRQRDGGGAHRPRNQGPHFRSDMAEREFSARETSQGQHAVRSRPPDFPPPRPHGQEVVTVSQPQLCYTPAQHIPLADYVSVDEEQLGSAHCDRARSPLYGDDAPYTILNAVDTTEPITAIFMGFQMAVDDSGQAPGHDGALRAELVVIGDEQETREGAGVREKKNHASLRRPAQPMGRQREGVEAAARRSRYQKDPEKTQTVLQCVLNGPTDTPRHDRPGLTRANQD